MHYAKIIYIITHMFDDDQIVLLCMVSRDCNQNLGNNTVLT